VLFFVGGAGGGVPCDFLAVGAAAFVVLGALLRVTVEDFLPLEADAAAGFCAVGERRLGAFLLLSAPLLLVGELINSGVQHS